MIDNTKIFDYLRNRKENILVTNFTFWPKFIGISLYLLDELQKINSENKVFYINWINNIHPEHISGWIPRSSKTLKKKSIDDPIEKYLSSNKRINTIDFDKNNKDIKLFEFQISETSIDWIKKLEIDGFNVGEPILSSYSKFFGVETNNSWNKNFVQKLLTTYSKIYYQILNEIEKNEITCIFLFNGRFIYEGAALNAARKKGIKVFYYESGGKLNDVDLYSHQTHDGISIQSRMADLTLEYPTKDLVYWGSNWFDSNSTNSLFTVWFSKIYFKMKLKGHKRRKKVIYYSSSDDELAWVGDQWKSSLGSQKQCIDILEEICKIHDLLLVVKIHPNLLTKSSNDRKYMLGYLRKKTSIITIKPYKIFNSYILMNFADLIVNYNSTIGIEAAYRNKTVVCLAPTLYNSFDATFDCKTREDLENIIMRLKKDELKPPIPKQDIKIYGAFMMLRGMKIADFFLYSDSFLIFQELKFGVKNILNRSIINTIKRIENLNHK